jgi:hypothetical protein
MLDSLESLGRREPLSDFERGVLDELTRHNTRLENLETQEFLTPLGGTLGHIETITGNQTTYDFQNIPAGYRHLKLIYSLRTERNALNDTLQIEVNGATSGYDSMRWQISHSATLTTQESLSGIALFPCFIAGDTAPSNEFAGGEIIIPDYADTGKYKEIHAYGSVITGTTTGLVRLTGGLGVWKSTAAINRLTLESGNPISDFVAASVASLYGTS